MADFFHGFSDHLADFFIAIGGNGTDLSDFGIGVHLAGATLEVGDNGFNSHVDTALEVHRVHAGSNRLHTFTNDRLSENGSGGGAITGKIIGLAGNFTDHLRAHVLELVFQFDFLGNADTVLGDAWCAERFVDNDVTAFWTEGDFYGIGENVDTFQHTLTGIGIKFDFFCSHGIGSS